MTKTELERIRNDASSVPPAVTFARSGQSIRATLLHLVREIESIQSTDRGGTKTERPTTV
jgi:hypothetical protein